MFTRSSANGLNYVFQNSGLLLPEEYHNLYYTREFDESRCSNRRTVDASNIRTSFLNFHPNLLFILLKLRMHNSRRLPFLIDK